MAARDDEPSGFATFIVRVSHDSAGTISGVVEWVRTGEKIRVHGFAAIAEVIAGFVERAPPKPRAVVVGL